MCPLELKYSLSTAVINNPEHAWGTPSSEGSSKADEASSHNLGVSGPRHPVADATVSDTVVSVSVTTGKNL